MADQNNIDSYLKVLEGGKATVGSGGPPSSPKEAPPGGVPDSPKDSTDSYLSHLEGTPRNQDPAKRSILTSSVLGKGAVDKIAGATSSALETFSKVLPVSLRAQQGVERYVHELVSKGGADVLDFATSPAGLGLIVANAFPLTAPFAAAADFALGGSAALQAVPDAVAMWRDPTPEKAAQLTLDLFAAHTLAKAGEKRVKASHADTPPGFTREVQEKVSGIEDHGMKMAALESARPKTGREAKLERVHATPGIGDIARLVGVPLPKIKEIASDLVRDRNNTLARLHMESARVATEFEKQVPVEERDISKIGYVIEGSITADQAGLSPKAREWVENLREHRRQMDDLGRKAYRDAIPLKDAETYLTHIWDYGGDEDKLQRAAKTLIHDPYLKKRSIDSYKVGIEMGLTPKFRDVADIIKVRDDFMARAAANSRMADTLRAMGTIVSEQEYKKLGLHGWDLAEGAHALDRATYGGKTAGGDPAMAFRPVRVHPDFQPAVEAIFKADSPGRVMLAADGLRSVSKKMNLNFSLFHENQLTEQGHAIDITRGKDIGEKLNRLRRDVYFLNPDFWQGIRGGLYDIGNRPESGTISKKIAKHLGAQHDPVSLTRPPEEVNAAIEAGLQLKSAEAESMLESRIRGMANSAEARLNEVRKAPKGSVGAKDTAKAYAGAGMAKLERPLVNVMHVLDKGLWDHYHTGMMLNSFETIVGDEMNRALRSGKEMKPEEIADLRKKIANHVNDAFGAVNYQNLMQSPTTVRWMNFLLLAPAWTLSNIRILMGAYESEAGYRLASKWVRGAALSWFLGTQLMNYATTSYNGVPDKNGKKGGHFTWDNAGAPLRIFGHVMPGLSENSLNVSAGYNQDSKGENTTQRFVKLGKSYREPMMWMQEFWQTSGAKIGSFPRWAMEMWTGHAPGEYEVISKDAPPGVKAAQRTSLTVGEFVPITLGDYQNKAMHYLFPEWVPKPASGNQYSPGGVPVGLPATSGITVSRATKAYLQANEDGDSEAGVEVLNAAAANNIDPRKVIRAAHQELSRRAKAKAKAAQE